MINRRLTQPIDNKSYENESILQRVESPSPSIPDFDLEHASIDKMLNQESSSSVNALQEGDDERPSQIKKHRQNDVLRPLRREAGGEGD